MGSTTYKGFRDGLVKDPTDIDYSDSPPALDVSPTVGLIPTTLLFAEGDVILPSVSVPRVTVTSPTEAATPEPDEDPPGEPLG